MRSVPRAAQVLQGVAPAGDERTRVRIRQEPAPVGGAAALMARLEAELESPFDLFGEAGLVRALLLSTSGSEHTLLLCIHHAGALAADDTVTGLCCELHSTEQAMISCLRLCSAQQCHSALQVSILQRTPHRQGLLRFKAAMLGSHASTPWCTQCLTAGAWA